MTYLRCESCKYMVPDKHSKPDDDYQGRCHWRPPVLLPSGRTDYPQLNVFQDWCGEHVFRDTLSRLVGMPVETSAPPEK